MCNHAHIPAKTGPKIKIGKLLLGFVMSKRLIIKQKYIEIGLKNDCVPPEKPMHVYGHMLFRYCDLIIGNWKCRSATVGVLQYLK